MIDFHKKAKKKPVPNYTTKDKDGNTLTWTDQGWIPSGGYITGSNVHGIAAVEPGIVEAVAILKKHGVQVHSVSHVLKSDEIPIVHVDFNIASVDLPTSYKKALEFVGAWTG
jgi:hypothetical protein